MNLVEQLRKRAEKIRFARAKRQRFLDCANELEMSVRRFLETGHTAQLITMNGAVARATRLLEL